MKNITGIILSLFILMLSGCSTCSSSEQENNQDAQIKKLCKEEARRYLKNRLVYIKDPETNLCFAYISPYTKRGIPTFSNVPCENIPKGMLNE